MMNKSLVAGVALSASVFMPMSAKAQLIDVSPLVPTALILPIVSIGVEEGLPVLGNLLTGTPLSEPLLGSFGAAKPVTDLLLGGDTLKGLSDLYAPLDMVLEPLVLTLVEGGL